MKRRNAAEGVTRKKKRWVLSVVIVGSIITAFVIACLVLLAVMTKKELGLSVGRYLAGRNGVDMVVMDDAPDSITDRTERERYMSPVVMSNRTERDLFKSLETGDKILFIHGGVKESYPGGTGVYGVFKLKSGSIEDIPQKLLNDLTAMGWLESAVEMNADFPDWGLSLSVRDATSTGLTLVCTREGGNATGELMCGTDYRLLVSENGVWKNVPTVIENYGWDDLGYRISEEQETEFPYSWEWLYGKLTPGTYRLAKDFMDFRGPGDYDKETYWVEFEVES